MRLKLIVFIVMAAFLCLILTFAYPFDVMLYVAAILWSAFCSFVICEALA